MPLRPAGASDLRGVRGEAGWAWGHGDSCRGEAAARPAARGSGGGRSCRARSASGSRRDAASSPPVRQLGWHFALCRVTRCAQPCK